MTNLFSVSLLAGVIFVSSPLVVPGQATTLQELFGFDTGRGSGRNLTAQRRSPRPQQPQYSTRQLTPITRPGLRYANALSGGIDVNGYYAHPFTPEQFWGVSLPDGNYRAVMLWEGQQVMPVARRLADGTVYFELPPNTVKVNTGNGFAFFDLSDANAMMFEVRGGLVRRQSYSFE